MTFGISSTAATLIAAGVAATGVAASVYSSDQARKARNKQQDALLAAQAADAKQAAAVDSTAAIDANNQLAALKKQRLASTLLASGDPTNVQPAAPATAGPSSILASGGST